MVFMDMDTQPTELPAVGAPVIIEASSPGADDPPPPYPSRERRSRTTGRTRRHRIQTVSSRDVNQSSLYTVSSDESHCGAFPVPAASETTPLLPPSHSLGQTPSQQTRRRRQSVSHTSVTSVAPSLAQTVLSLFSTDNELEDEDFHLISHPYRSQSEQDNPAYDGGAGIDTSRSGSEELCHLSGDVPRSEYGCRPTGLSPGSVDDQPESRGRFRFFNCAPWKRYFRPLGHAVYYRALFHLLVLNFPYALIAWIYLFVFTLTGTTLLMALPLGAILCFLDLLGARAFARGELALQTRFHSPLAYPPPYPPRPIFTRFRSLTPSEIEQGVTVTLEPSFYKNTHAMFTDPTSYQALFYFIVIKPSITILLSLFLLVFVVPAMILVLPAPAALRAVRRLGAWQANVAIEGLYLAVR